MADLKFLAAEMRRWQSSCKETGDDYDEDGQPERAQYLWGEAEGYRHCAEMLDREIERETRDV